MPDEEQQNNNVDWSTLSGLLNMLGGLDASKQSNWNNAFAVNILNTLNQGLQQATEWGFPAWGDARSTAQYAQQQMLPWIFGSRDDAGNFNPGLVDRMNLSSQEYLDQNLPQQYWDPDTGFYEDPQYQDLMQGYQNLMGQAGDIWGAGQDVFDLFGQGTQNFADAQNSARIMAGGQSGQQQNIDQLAAQFGANGGVSPQIQQLFGVGGGILGAGGENPTTQALQQLGLGFAGKDALLPSEWVANQARDQTATQNLRNTEALQRRANARGGGPGVLSGMQMGARNTISDQGLQNEAGAFQQALLGQQGLGLQQQGLGSQMATGGLGLANSRLGLGGNLTESGLGAQLGRGNAAANMYGANIASMLQGLGSMNQQQQLLNSLGQMGLGAQNDALNLGGSLNTNMGNLWNTQMLQNLNRLNAGNSAQIAGMGAQAQVGNIGSDMWKTAFGGMQNAGNTGLDFLKNMYGTISAQKPQPVTQIRM